MWMFEGFLKHSLDISILEYVASKYIKIGLVPTDYNQPEFYLKKKSSEWDVDETMKTILNANWFINYYYSAS